MATASGEPGGRSRSSARSWATGLARQLGLGTCPAPRSWECRPVGGRDAFGNSIVGYEGWVVGGELVESSLNAHGRSLFVFSVQAPTSSSQPASTPLRRGGFRILALIGEQLPSQADVILGGDFNFLSLGDRKEGEDIETTPAEQAALTRFSELGLVSCWTAAHPGRALAQTLRWTGDKSPDRSTPYHCDGIFVPGSWRTKMFCEVLTSATFKHALEPSAPLKSQAPRLSADAVRQHRRTTKTDANTGTGTPSR